MAMNEDYREMSDAFVDPEMYYLAITIAEAQGRKGQAPTVADMALAYSLLDSPWLAMRMQMMRETCGDVYRLAVMSPLFSSVPPILREKFMDGMDAVLREKFPDAVLPGEDE
jgi:hypothetical protein